LHTAKDSIMLLLIGLIACSTIITGITGLIYLHTRMPLNSSHQEELPHADDPNEELFNIRFDIIPLKSQSYNTKRYNVRIVGRQHCVNSLFKYFKVIPAHDLSPEDSPKLWHYDATTDQFIPATTPVETHTHNLNDMSKDLHVNEADKTAQTIVLWQRVFARTA
jgi:hypothetical protein